MDWQAIFAGVGAILTGAGGCALVIREFRRRDRRALKREVDDLSTDITALRTDLVACRRYAFGLAEILVHHGHEPPPPPELHHEIELP